MVEALIASISTVTLFLVIGWLLRTWIKERLAASLRLETDTLLEALKSRHAKQTALTESRVKAYGELWQKTIVLNPRERLCLDQSQLNDIFNDLRKWYYEDGNAMHLSAQTTNDFLKGLQYLEQLPTEENLNALQKIFSSVRTRMKEDLGVYDRSDVHAKIPDYDKPLADGTVLSKPCRDD